MSEPKDNNIIDFEKYKKEADRIKAGEAEKEEAQDGVSTETADPEDDLYEEDEDNESEGGDCEEPDSDKREPGKRDRLHSLLGNIVLLAGLVLIFAGAFYARYRLNSKNENPEESVTATGSNASDEKAQKYAWWYERDVTEGAGAATSGEADEAYRIGDRVFCGTYSQGPDGEAEAVAWTVLDVDDDYALLVSEYVLDVMPYSTSGIIQWENSDVRKWLSDSFYQETFSEEEKGKIMCFEIENEDNPMYNTDGGHDTDDSLFLLSIEDIKDYFGGMDTKCLATPYAQEKGITVGTNSYTTYWLRSPGSMDIIGSEPGYAANIDYSGEIKYYGNDVTFDVIGIRPAMWVKL